MGRNEEFNIPLGDGWRDLARAAQTDAEMSRIGRERPVNLADHADLQAHLMDAHDIDDGDLWRNSHDESHPALRPASGDDRRLSRSEIFHLHAHDHSSGDYPGMTVGDEHFH